MIPASFPATRAAALQRWQEFQPRINAYAAKRNQVEPGHPHVSRLSPAIRCRLISEEEICTATLQTQGLNRAEKFLQEIVWRQYWKSWLELRPQVWSQYRAELPALSESTPRAEAVALGQSGVAIMDHFARELMATGYLHNHARMWFAAFWIHVEKLPWQLGADFFYRHLLDADPASNTLSWRWIAGLQTKGKTYLVRRSNLEKYCAPSLLADETGLERLDDAVVRPCEVLDTCQLTPRRMPSELPDLTGIAQPYGLWLQGEDLTPELGELAELRPASIATFSSTPLQARYGLSPLRQEYLATALADGRSRASQHYGVEAESHSVPSLAQGLAEWALRHQLKTVIALQPWVGPLADELPAISAELHRCSVNLVLTRRATDLSTIPEAKAGYFSYWEEVKQRIIEPH